MYGPPGHAYVYFTYGNHHMLNFVTEPEGAAGAVLVRALEPLEGDEVMMRRRLAGRRSASTLSVRDLANGPGKLTCALGVGLSNNGEPLDGSATLSVLRLRGPTPEIATSGRIGLGSGHEAELRFYVRGNRYLSTARPGPRVSRRSETKGVS
jgi:DNA-3-methyladenine glycosylase